MSVVASDIVIYGSANMPEADSGSVGGAISSGSNLCRLAFADLGAAMNVQAVSSHTGDTSQDIAVTGKNPAGSIVSETLNLNGQTPVAATTVTSWERLLKAIKAATCAGDVAIEGATAVATGTAQGGSAASASAPARIQLAAGGGASAALGMVVRITNNTPSGVQAQIRYIVALDGDYAYVNKDWSTVPTSGTTYRLSYGMVFAKTPAEEYVIRRPFYGAEADIAGGSTRNYYEKVFVKNNNGATALNGATVAELSDPSGKITFALESSLDGTDTSTNRITAPGGYTFNSSSKNVANSQSLTAGAAQGMWLNLTLAAGDAAAKSSWAPRIQGSTT